MESLTIDSNIIERLSDEEKVLLTALYEEKNYYEKGNNQAFYVLLTETIPVESKKFNLIYVISEDCSVIESNLIRRFGGVNAIKDALQCAILDYRNRRKNVLLYLGKFPGYGFDVDGGSILARQLINSLKVRCNLTVCFIRKNEEKSFKIV